MFNKMFIESKNYLSKTFKFIVAFFYMASSTSHEVPGTSL